MQGDSGPQLDDDGREPGMPGTSKPSTPPDRAFRPEGRRGVLSNVELFVRAQREPGWLNSPHNKMRDKALVAVETLRARFKRPLLAMIVLLEDRIRSAHGTRQGFIDHLKKADPQHCRLINKHVLSAQLGGRRASGPDELLARLVG
ncbi:hypothetical protein, partial [Streptomyces sp. WAC 06738]|uniref:hypothetical protein n=1 Tax=Streptomyces sp. WAC 06738 TaxID=2203210 RepID=UPI0013DE997D